MSREFTHFHTAQNFDTDPAKMHINFKNIKFKKMSAYNLCDDDVPRLNILRNNTRMGRVIPFGNLTFWGDFEFEEYNEL